MWRKVWVISAQKVARLQRLVVDSESRGADGLEHEPGKRHEQQDQKASARLM